MDIRQALALVADRRDLSLEDMQAVMGQIMSGEATFETLEKWITEKGEPVPKSGRQEMLESIFMSYC